ncbi:MAG: AAA family ATPase, partial [Porphyromonadaceae bacterium]|nr:AAA family ATPase [Porphyromonadaceae bacterium]
MQNPELELAQQIIEKTDMHLFLTGKAGTGKTTFLRRLVQHSKKRIIVLAPTGIAAINAGGCSIHSFFQLGFAPFIPDSQVKINFRLSKKKKRLIKNLDLIII